MTTHDDDVAAVLVPFLRHRPTCGYQVWNVALDRPEGCTCGAKDRALAALTAAGYAVVKLPEDAAVEHGARLVDKGRMPYGVTAPRVFAIEDSP